LLWLPACDQGAAPDHSQHIPPDGGTCGHIDQASGVLLRSHNQTLLRYFQFSFDPQYSDAITVPKGGFIHHVTVNFLDNTGAPIQIAEDCLINRLEWEVTTPSFVQVTQNAESRWAVDVMGKNEGTTQIRLRLMHDSHSHFALEPIPIRVTAPQP